MAVRGLAYIGAIKALNELKLNCDTYVGSSVAFCEGLRYIAPNMKETKPTMILAVPALFENMYKKLYFNIYGFR